MNSHSGDWSIEATLPKPDEIETARSILDEGTKVFLNTLPHVSLEDQQVQTARIVRANGLEPVLHVAARYFATRTELVGAAMCAARSCPCRSVVGRLREATSWSAATEIEWSLGRPGRR